MNALKWSFLPAALWLLAAVPVSADLLIRMDETALQGTYKGGTDAAMIFDVRGQVQQVNVTDVLCLLMSARPGATAPAAAPTVTGAGPTTLLLADGSTLRGTYKGGTDAAMILDVKGEVRQVGLADVRLLVNERPAPPPPVAAAPVVTGSGTAPVGTKLMVTLTQDVTTASHSKGSVVEGVLAAPLSVGGTVLAPQGAKVFGKVIESRGGKVLGGSYIMLSFTSLQVGEAMIPIQTSEVGAEAGKGGAAKKVGAGALIGAAAGDAGAGAAVGGAVALLAGGGNHLQIPKGTTAEVALTAEVKIGP